MWKSPVARAALWFIPGAAIAAAIGVHHWNTQQGDPARLRAILLSNVHLLADDAEVMAALRTVLRERQLNSDGEARQRLLAERWKTFTHAAFSPSLGDPAARSLLIEFTDYGCEPCRASATAVQGAVAADPDLRVVVMLVPTSGAVSEFAARVGYAAYRQNPRQFARLHELLMSEPRRLSQAGVLAQAAAAGLDIEQIQAEIRTNEVRAYLAEVRRLAQELRVPGVPTFVSGKRLLSGGASAAQITDLVRSAKTTIPTAQRSR